jgi:hypothetical protein
VSSQRGARDRILDAERGGYGSAVDGQDPGMVPSPLTEDVDRLVQDVVGRMTFY